jgi:hypothetical protein
MTHNLFRVSRLLFAHIMAFPVLIPPVAAALPVSLQELPVCPEEYNQPGGDWLVGGTDRKAAVFRSDEGRDLILTNGLIRRVFRLEPDGATVAFDNLMTGAPILRGVKPEARVEIDGRAMNVGGLTGQPNYAFLMPEWLDGLERDPEAMHFTGFETGKPRKRMEWKRVRHHAPDANWPPAGIHLRMDYTLPDGSDRIQVSVHYELYDGVPVLSKWITVSNNGDAPATLNRFTSEILAAVEYSSTVEDRGVPFETPNLHVETDYAMGGMSARDTSRFSVHWVPDPQYETQVNYVKKNPCLLEVQPERGPEIEIAPGESFASFHAFILVLDGYDRERNGLAQRRMYRVIAPWVTENPLMMHVRYADEKAVKNAIDQCAAVGFEMVILTFGSGFNIENTDKGYLETMQDYAAYARGKGIEIGGYSLLASRSIDAENDVVTPEGQAPTFGHSPCLGSEWGAKYFRQLYRFYNASGFMLLEHDGSYPGDVCLSEVHPGHEGLADSRWKQWRIISDFYKWCRGNGIYLNVPDYYYLSGANKCGMGYRETNWSLPRAQQVIHTRQNIHDGTWTKTPSMGWMFVPLTEYHGGGEAATIEPLDEHRDHYEKMLYSNLAMGVQACYRGPRLYDTDRTRALVKKWVDWYKQYRDILESDIIHGRRADGRDIDWMLHVNPRLEHKGMLVIFNPLPEQIERELEVNLYYTGLKEKARVRDAEGESREITLNRDYSVTVPVSMAPESFTWFVLEAME